MTPEIWVDFQSLIPQYTSLYNKINIPTETNDEQILELKTICCILELISGLHITVKVVVANQEHIILNDNEFNEKTITFTPNFRDIDFKNLKVL